MEGIGKKRSNDDENIFQMVQNLLQEEKRARFFPEMNKDSVWELLEKAQQDALTANANVKTLEDKNKMLQEHNIKLENQLKSVTKNLEKQDALEYCLTKEKEARIVLEKKLHSLWEELQRANQKVKALEDKNRMLQEHNIKLERATKNLADVGSESEKLDALECLTKEKEARVVLENKLDFLREELQRANEKVKTLEEKNKMLQEHNAKVDNANKNLEREKDMILKYNITLEKLCVIYEAQVADAKDSGDDAAKQKETSEEN